jgi:hypothetical protein
MPIARFNFSMRWRRNESAKSLCGERRVSVIDSARFAFAKGSESVSRGRIAKRLSRVLTLVIIATFGIWQVARATTWVYVPDVSQLLYQTSGNLIYFRNFNQFNSSALGCCYNYWIDTSTTEGKNTFALMMAAAAQAKPMYFGVPDGYVSGIVILNGIW